MIKTLLKTVATQNIEAVQLAVNLIEDGAVVALPTDTIYGVACDVQNNKGLNSLYALKKRDLAKPVAICVDCIKNISYWGITDNIPKQLLKDLLPGPVTIVLKRTKYLNPLLNPTCDKVGIRIPDSVFIQNVVSKLGKPLALTSANISNEPSCISTEEFEPLWPHLAAVFDGGTIGDGERTGSTVVDLSVKGQFKVIRKGMALSLIIERLYKHGLTECINIH